MSSLTFQILLVLLTIGGMAVLLLGVNRLFHSGEFEDVDDADRLRSDVRNSSDVISGHSVFHQFLARGERDSRHRKNSAGRHHAG